SDLRNRSLDPATTHFASGGVRATGSPVKAGLDVVRGGCCKSPRAAMDGKPIDANPTLVDRLPAVGIAQEFEAAAADWLASVSAQPLGAMPDHHLIDEIGLEEGSGNGGAPFNQHPRHALRSKALQRDQEVQTPIRPGGHPAHLDPF